MRALVAAIAGAIFFFLLARPAVATAAWGVGGLTLLLALVSPLGAYAALDRAVGKVGEWIGTLLTWLLLGPFFYVFVAPFGLLLRRGARDKMQRRLDPDAETYWQKRDADRPLDRPY